MKDFNVIVTAASGYTPKVVLMVEGKPGLRIPSCFNITNPLGELAHTDVRIRREQLPGENVPGDVNIFDEVFEVRQIEFRTPYGKVLTKQQLIAESIDYDRDSADEIKRKIQSRVNLIEGIIQDILDERDECA